MPKLLVRSLLWLCLVLAFARCSGETVTSLGPSDRPVRRTYTFTLDVPPRLQWNENSGYCGETSFICAGLYFGQYCSQFTAREMASPGVPQSDPSSQLLLGVNDRRAAEMMRLQTIEFDSRAQRSTDELLAWVKRQALAGHIVIIGVFNNGIILGEWTSVQDGDSEYDHIGPVLGIKSNEPLDSRPGEYLPEDELTFCDNGLFGPSIGSPPTMYQFLFPYTFKSFPGTRVEANNPNGPIYMLKNTPPNYGVAVTGVVDPDRVTVPVRLRSSSDAPDRSPQQCPSRACAHHAHGHGQPARPGGKLQSLPVRSFRKGSHHRFQCSSRECCPGLDHPGGLGRGIHRQARRALGSDGHLPGRPQHGALGAQPETPLTQFSGHATPNILCVLEVRPSPITCGGGGGGRAPRETPWGFAAGL
ncbi:hypothetical protein DYH09_18715 [bacterium CPR1]|nr:hypothetical protein [bacterium CPR1]